MTNSTDNHNTTEITPAACDVVRLVQITDSHIFSEPEGCLLGLNTRKSLDAVCKRVKLEEWRADALLATGDLSQDASASSYQHLAAALSGLDIATFWVAGNHDDPSVIAQNFVNKNISPTKHILIGHWQIILLDSSVRGKVYGELLDSELKFLEEKLSQHSDKHTLVALHHHPFDVGSNWIDELGLKDNQAFHNIVKQYKNVKGVLWGHIHQEFDQTIDDIRWLASPSSCVQFAPKSEAFSADKKAPGYRVLELYNNGDIQTNVHRIDNINFTVDYSIKGY